MSSASVYFNLTGLAAADMAPARVKMCCKKMANKGERIDFKFLGLPFLMIPNSAAAGYSGICSFDHLRMSGEIPIVSQFTKIKTAVSCFIWEFTCFKSQCETSVNGDVSHAQINKRNC